MYLGGGWAVRVPEGQVRRRVVGEGLEEEVGLNFFGGKGVNWRKIYVLLWGWDGKGGFFLRFGKKNHKMNSCYNTFLSSFVYIQ